MLFLRMMGVCAVGVACAAQGVVAERHRALSVLTWHNDNARTGQNLEETILTPANVNAANFGKLFTIPVDGKVDAQPLYVSSLAIPGNGTHNVVYVETEHDSSYAFDADTGALVWKVSVLGPGEGPSDDRNCGQVTPEIGITATPVIDPLEGPHGTIYLIAMSRDGSGNYHHRLHALDLATGAEELGGPVEVQASYPGSGVEGSRNQQIFNPAQHKERAALLLANGMVYTSWSSHCDIPPYTSWVIAYNESTLAQVAVLNLIPDGSDGGIWMAGAGPAGDAAGNVYLLTGNGTFETTLTAGGFPSQQDYGNAFVKIQPPLAGRPMTVVDYFTMSDTVAESDADQDLGSGGIMLMPPVLDASGQPRELAVGAGKDANLYVVDQNNLGKYKAYNDQIFQEMTGALPQGVYSSPAWFNGRLYYGAVGANLKAFAFTNGSFAPNLASQSANSFPYPGATPSISADGAGSGIVWAAENSASATLHAYDANNLGVELYNSNQAGNGRDQFGAGNKFIVPTIANGKVYVGTTAGVGVFGLLCISSVTPSRAAFPPSGGNGQIAVTAGGGCSWTAASRDSWLTITSSASGTGQGVINFSVGANAGRPRTGAVVVGNRIFTLHQASSYIPRCISPACK